MNQNLTIPVTSLFPTFTDVLMAENPLSIIHKITGGLRPSRTRVEINDKLAKVIFKLSDEGTGELLSGDTFCIVEKRSKKFGEVTTTYKILNAASYQVLRPFTMFDHFVLAVCISEWLVGNRYTTVAIIYRALTGKLGKGDSNPSVTQHKAIIKSLEILMSRIVDYGAEDTCQVMGYNNGNPFVAKVPLLPAAYIDFSTLNGDSDTLIFFTDEPPLLKMAQIKKNLHLMMLSLKDKLKYQLQLAFIPFIFLIETALIISYNKLALCFLNFVLLATIIL